MGVYDMLGGPCPRCGEEIEGIQIKWFSSLDECFRSFRPGDKLPVPIADGAYPVSGYGTPCCRDKRILLAVVSDGKFMGFRLAAETLEEAAQRRKEELGMGDDPTFHVHFII
jgi:hypothetical protein